MVGGQLIFLQKINALFHIQLSKIEPSRLMVQCPKVCMEICGQMSIPGMNLTKHAKCFLHQSNRLLRILFQRCSAVQQTSPVRSCSHSLIGQDCSQLVYDRLHPRFIAVLIHVLKYIFQKQQISRHIILIDGVHDHVHYLKNLPVIHKVHSVAAADGF